MRKFKFESYSDFAIVLRGIEEVVDRKEDEDTRGRRDVVTHFIVDIEIIARKKHGKVGRVLFRYVTEQERQALIEQVNKSDDGIGSIFVKKDLAEYNTWICDNKDLWFEKEGINYSYTNLHSGISFSTIIPVEKNSLKKSLSSDESFKNYYNNMSYNGGYYSGILSYMGFRYKGLIQGFDNITNFIIENCRNVISFRGNEEGEALSKLNAEKAANERRIRSEEWKKSFSVIMNQVKLMPEEQQTEYIKMLESLNSAAIARISM